MARTADAVAVGFDLGHGESAVAWAHVDKAAPPGVVDLPGAASRQHVTAVAEHPTRGILVGEAAVSDRAVTALFLAFKAPYLDREEVRRPIELFVTKVREDVGDHGLLPVAPRTRWVFGAPSSWSRPLMADYAELLRDTGIPEVDVVPESRAALLYARETAEVRLDMDHITGAVLIIDLGSSTTDFTLVEDRKAEPFDYGTELGAHLIDKAIKTRVLRAHPEAEMLESLLDDDQYERLRLELRCRKAKEAFFRTDPGRFAANPAERTEELYVLVTPQRKVYIPIELSAEDMDEVLRTPQPALDGQSWLEAFRADIVLAAESMGRAPDAVLLTGGASRMRFVRQIAAEEFGADRVLLGSEPEVAIARGLALAGRMSVRAEGFRRNVDKLIKGNQIKALVKDRLPGLADQLGEAAASGMTQRHVIPAFRRWRSGQIRTLNEVAAGIATAVHHELTDPANPTLATVISDWQNGLRPDLDELTRPICERWHIPPAAMQLPPIKLGERKWQISMNHVGAATEGLDSLANAVSAVIAGVLAMTLFGTGVALLATTGPFAVVIAAVAGYYMLKMGKDAAMEKALAADLPAWIREMRGEDKLVAKLDQQAAAQESQLASELSRQFQADGGVDLEGQISQLIAKELDRLAEDAELLIS
jgi:hypothetical protein